MTRMASLFTTCTTLVVVVVLCATPLLAKARLAHSDRVEARITALHTQLHITLAQETLWTQVAMVMRDNAKTLDALTTARFTQAQTLTAVEDLRAYTDITAAHAEGLKKLLPVFEALYTSMSDTQQQQADTLFRQRIGQRVKRP